MGAKGEGRVGSRLNTGRRVHIHKRVGEVAIQVHRLLDDRSPLNATVSCGRILQDGRRTCVGSTVVALGSGARDACVAYIRIVRHSGSRGQGEQWACCVRKEEGARSASVCAAVATVCAAETEGGG